VLAHPSVFIWGTIEARVQGVDCLILGALNEGTWPAIATPDHWLNRAMRRDAGLLLPERTIGLAAHDFQQAMGARNVTLTRSRRAGDAETVASRWINRLTGVLAGLPDADGPLALQQMKDRGNDLLALAAQVQAPPARLPPASRPKPAPPAAARPRVMSVTDVVRLITDPYAVYARKILGLSPLAPVLPQADPRSRGTLYHDILNHYARNLTGDADRAALLAAIARDRIATTVAWPLTRVLWQARFMAAIDTILAFDDLHPGTRLLNEDKGDTELWPGGTVLHARPDRIDLMDDGRVHLIDFKSAAPDKTAVKDFQKQLALEAVIAADGGFGPDLAQRAALTSYVGLKAGAATRQENLDLAAIADQRAGVVALLRHYADQASGYTASRIALVTEAGDYDHLARRTEWMLSDTPVLTPVGGDR
jgi:ATP-dependent helicase/nuclease subunit B